LSPKEPDFSPASPKRAKPSRAIRRLVIWYRRNAAVTSLVDTASAAGSVAGAATSMALNGVPEYLIKDMGGWSRSSSAFNVYIGRAPQKQRAAYTRFLSQQYSPNVSQGFSHWTLGVIPGQPRGSGPVEAAGLARGAFGAAVPAQPSVR
jgi:hypothetical protein